MFTWSLLVLLAHLHQSAPFSDESRPRTRTPGQDYDEFGALITTKPRPRAPPKRTPYTGTPTHCTRTNLSDSAQRGLFSRISAVVEAKFPSSPGEMEECFYQEPKFDDLTEHIRKNYHMKDAATNKYIASHMYQATSDWELDYTDKGSPMQMAAYFAETRFNHVTNRTHIPIREAYSIIVYGTNKRSAAGDVGNPKRSKKNKNADKQKSQTSRVEDTHLLSTGFAQRMNELVQSGMYRQRPLSSMPKEQRRQVWNEVKPKNNRGRDLQGSPSLVTSNVNTQTNNAGSSHFINMPNFPNMTKNQRRQAWPEMKAINNHGRYLQGSPSLVTSNVNTQTNNEGSSHFPNVASRHDELEKRQEELERASWLEQLDKNDGGIFRDTPGTPPPSW